MLNQRIPQIFTLIHAEGMFIGRTKEYINKKAPILKRTRAFQISLSKRAVRTGLEPVTPCVTGMYSNQLN